MRFFVSFCLTVSHKSIFCLDFGSLFRKNRLGLCPKIVYFVQPIDNKCCNIVYNIFLLSPLSSQTFYIQNNRTLSGVDARNQQHSYGDSVKDTRKRCRGAGYIAWCGQAVGVTLCAAPAEGAGWRLRLFHRGADKPET